MRQTEIAVIGGGPAGLGAAIAAARTGAEVVLLDEQSDPGGQLRHRIAEVAPALGAPPRRAPALAAELVAEAAALGVDLRRNAVAWGIFAGNVLGVVEGEAADQLAAEAIVVATGSTDLPFPFAGGSLPGVFSARAVQILLHRHRVLPGRRFAVVGAGPEAAEVAADVRLAGGEVVAAIDPGQGAAIAAAGSNGVETLTVDGARQDVDVIVVAVGRQPDAALALMAGCAVGFAPSLGGHVPIVDDTLRSTVPGLLVAGDAAGICDATTALAEGRFAGLSAAALLGRVGAKALTEARLAYEADAADRIAARRRLEPVYVQTYEEEPGLPSFARPEGTRESGVGGEGMIDKAETAASFACRCEEVTLAEVRAAIANGARTVNDVKRRTRAGMGLCQGIFCVPTIAALLQAETGTPLAATAPMTARPPVRPIPLDLLADSEP